MFNPNRINIHELTIEESEKPSELPFDPERDITEEDWRIMEDFLERERGDNNWHLLPVEAMTMKVLNPDVEIRLDKNDWQKMQSQLQDEAIGKRWSRFFSQSTAMKILDPEIDIKVYDSDDWREMQDELNYRRKCIGGMRWLDFSEYAMGMMVLNPKFYLGLNNTVWEGMKKDLNDYKEADNWERFTYLAAYMKIFFPEKANDLNLDENVWHKMRDQLQKLRKGFKEGRRLEFPVQAINMKILAAEKVEVTDKGLEITMPKKKKSLESTTPPLPETKKF